ncbi:ABC-three component system protein [Streptomonospora litoralis]|uniref:ABC-three component systems C-terminal domain-containing protein n=1 Tax=Streptomonospora litoralis TaxID=2498135 RepID=A0A4P6Q6Y3_9ACTN|nr:ABC-three component system protein [Streptomonospora litoralis]QBI56495.1 hypothetical protein EKD16_23745 [Streptomonospora litoralis]
MELWQRNFVRAALRSRLNELHGEEFETFFHKLMELRDPGFLGVRTYGDYGDLGADGLTVNARRLYACYAPQSVRQTSVKSKFRRDLSGALEKRSDEFDTFVFVHNDLRGILPAVTSAISHAKADHPQLRFEAMGANRLFREIRRLDLDDIEELLGPLPVREVVTGVGMEDVAPLLDHLAQSRTRTAPPDGIPIPPQDKLEYNGFSADYRQLLVRQLPYVPLVEAYYQQRTDPSERDETAGAFRDEYSAVRDGCSDPDDMLDQLLQYILGNKSASLRVQSAALTVLMYFFGECEIFRIPPSGWQTERVGMEGAG